MTRDDPALDLAALGLRIRAMRKGQSLTLAELAGRAEISLSMLSSVERGEKAATVLVLHRIATGLGTSIARLVEDESPARAVVLRRSDQVVVPGPGDWTRRILSPVIPGVEFEMMQTTIPPGVDTGTYGPHPAGSHEYLMVEAGTLTLTLDAETHRLGAGDSIYYDGACRHGYRNDGEAPCRYVLAMMVRRPR
ncbi:helix-turn-helix domain-containing protein [Thalassobaculum salexigens]|uniref:helix-turn-helix domain-containing protein n=1 Tax=Thalassobaculum salexigens TaxID=455360 RepID=UPI000413E068|nr:XRE family transcriptional regulator [Thalassobaculum salexigens]